MKTNFFKTYLLPGITFQSIVIAGGYGTGQEINQYFLSLGPVNGFYGLLVTTLVWSVICSLCFVLAQSFKAFDYKSFFKVLLGKGWFLFEICYLYLVIIVLSIVAASVASMLEEMLHIPYSIGLVLPLAYILFMVLKGNRFIEKMFTFWSFLLYAVFMVFFCCCFQRHGMSSAKIAMMPEGISWLKSGIAYASYNLGCVPAILFSLKYLKDKKSAAISGLLVGPIASIPAVLLYLALLTHYPAILEATVPATVVLKNLGYPLLTVFFTVVLMGTLIETGVGLVHAFNERIQQSYSQSVLKKFKRGDQLLILLLLCGAFVLSQFGLVNLIAQGYTVLTWAILAVFIVPLLSFGFFKIRRHAFVNQLS